MADIDERPPRQQLLDALRPLCPDAWLIVTDERKRDDTERVLLQLLQRTIEPPTDGARKNHPIGFLATISVAGTDLGAAEDELDDQMVEFLHALSGARISWTTATKALYEGRLGYQLNININSRKVKE